MTVWYTSDLHLGHANIIKYCNRPFDDVPHMNAEIIKRWNEVVDPLDTVHVLGDVALGKLDDSLPLVMLLNGKKLLVPGNHDRCWSGNKKRRPQDISRYTDVGFEIMPEDTMSNNGWRINHMPFEGDSQEGDRYKDHRPVPAYPEEWLIHGHVHNAWKRNGYMINCGVDVWNFYPVHEDEIREIMGLL